LNPHRAVIPPVEGDENRPLWSVMIPTYNCAGYFRKTLESVLVQDPGPEQMQIEVVDDCSTDDVASVADEFRDRVSFYRQPRNLGNVGNFNTCLTRARGRLIHILHGDDLVRQGYYDVIGAPLQRDPEIGAAFCRWIAIDGDGNWKHLMPLVAREPGVLSGWLEALAQEQRLQPPCISVRREVYERLGGFDDRLTYGEDWEMWTRIAAHYPVWHEPEPFACYRIHGGTISNRTLRTGQNVVDLRRAIAINRELLPPDREGEITREALRVTALTALRRGRRHLGQGQTETAVAQLREAVATSHSMSVLVGALFFLALLVRRAVLVRLGLR
jgi:glycosyltransferase involved in cell wall biosynthesis